MADHTHPSTASTAAVEAECPHCRREGTITVGVNVCADCGLCVLLTTDGSLRAWAGRIEDAYAALRRDD